jgi:cyclopropane fatty-acyl-phospholipid synthase-like methyltransferase
VSERKAPWRIGDDLADGRGVAPAAERNKAAILEVLSRVLPRQGLVLEIGSGTGQHVCHFARALPGLVFQPSDPDVDMRRSIARWIAHEDLQNVLDPMALDVLAPSWPIVAADAVISINMIHVAPWAATQALFAHASRVLSTRAPLVLYGPFHRDGAPTAESNARFDESLRAHDPTWGVRDLGDVAAVAAEAGFSQDEVVAMPANNLCVVFRRN